MTCLWLFLWKSYRNSMLFLLDAYDISMGLLWGFYCIPVGFLWESDRISMIFLLSSYPNFYWIRRPTSVRPPDSPGPCHSFLFKCLTDKAAAMHIPTDRYTRARDSRNFKLRSRPKVVGALICQSSLENSADNIFHLLVSTAAGEHIRLVQQCDSFQRQR